MDSLKTIAKGAGIVFVGVSVSKLLTYIYRIIVARIGVEEYGILSLALALFGIATVFAVAGLNVGVTRYFAFYRAKQDEAGARGVLFSSLKITALLGAALAALLIIFGKPIASFFHEDLLAPVLILFAVGIPFYAVKEVVLAAITAAKQMVDSVLVRNVFEGGVKLLLTLGLVSLGFGLLGAAWAHLIALAAATLLGLYLLQTRTFSLTSANASPVSRELLSYSLPVMFTTLFAQLITWTDVLMLGYFRTAGEVGIYNAALPTAALLSIIPGGILTLFVPVMTELLAAQKSREFSATYQTSSKWIFFMNLALFALLIFFAPEILALLFGAEYAAGGSSLIILAGGYLIYQTFAASLQVLQVIEKTRLVMIDTLIAALVNIVLNALLIPWYGMMGGAAATAASLSLFGIMVVFQAHHFTGMHPFRPSYLKAAAAGALGLASIAYIPWGKGLLRIIVLGVIFAGVYGISLLVLRSMDEEDVEILRVIERKSGIRMEWLQKMIQKFA